MHINIYKYTNNFDDAKLSLQSNKKEMKHCWDKEVCTCEVCALELAL